MGLIPAAFARLAMGAEPASIYESAANSLSVKSLKVKSPFSVMKTILSAKEARYQATGDRI